MFLILWCIRAKDAREYAKFVEEHENSVKQINPIYRDPVGRYEVPKALSIKYDENPFASWYVFSIWLRIIVFES